MESLTSYDLAYKFINQTHKNVFLTGKAGTGKTTFLHKITQETHKKTMIVADVIVNPPQTNLLKSASSIGAKTIDGLGMVVNQAVIGVKYWTNFDVDPSTMHAELQRVLKL